MKDKNIKIHYTELWGLRAEKYDWLKSHEVQNTKWQKVVPAEPYYFFVPMEKAGWDLYEKFWKVTDVFPVNSVGIVTARDKLTIQWSEHEVWTTISHFLSLEPEQARLVFGLGEDVRDWKVSFAQEDLKETGPNKDRIVPILYRPFDVRYTYYTGKSRGFHCMSRPEVMQHILRPNLALSLTKRHPTDDFYSDVFAGEQIVEGHLLSGSLGITYTFPLYLYEETEVTKEKRNPGVSVMMLFDKPRDGGYKVKRPNINLELHASLNNAFNPQSVAISDITIGRQNDFCISPEEIFYYLYAVLYSNVYRQKYQEFLKIDFPKIPFTKDYKIFQKLAKLGEELVELHLLKSKELEKPIAKFQGKNDNLVEKREYKNGRVYINDEQYFEGIKPEVWEYQIGGYQVLDKWLKDRKARELSAEDIKHYCQIVSALSQTIKIQKQIDKFYPEIEKSLLSVK